MMDIRKYHIELCKGTGLIQETLQLLNIYQVGMNRNELTRIAVESNLLVKVTENRIKDIVQRAFYKRYVINDPYVPIYLNTLMKHFSSLDVISQIFLIYTSRANYVLMDFIIQVYWYETRKGSHMLNTVQARKFITDTIKQTDLVQGWSEITQTKVARYIIATLVDFRFLDKDKNLKPVFLHDVTANYLAHELHFNGLSDNAIIEAEEWLLFGYSRYDILKHLERISFQGHFIFQTSGEMVKINWIYKNMGEFTDAIR
jgi:hypothetical protein